MTEAYKRYKPFFILLFIGLAGFLIWYFSQIVVFIIVALVVSIIGTPLVELLHKIRIGRHKFPHGLSVAITLILILAVFLGLFSFFIPLVVKEAGMIAMIDSQKLIDHFHPQIEWLQGWLQHYGVLAKESTIESSLKEMVVKMVDLNAFSNILSSVITFTGSFFFNMFSILFLSFFFLHDHMMMPRLILHLVSEKYREGVKNVMMRSKKLLSRYFIGMIIQIMANIISYSVALLIVGVNGALVIAFFAGIIIIIPYLGGIIAIITGTLLGVTGVISMGNYDQIGPMALKIILAMLIVQLIDNNVFQPLIQGKSVKAHPVEIFLVVIAAASLGGVLGMIIAVPAYGFLKIVATEVLSHFKSTHNILK